MERDRFQKIFLLLLVIAVTALFGRMLKSFLMSILLAAIFAGLARPLYNRLLTWMRGRKVLASLTTLLIVFLVVAVPLGAVLGVVASQALRISETAIPWAQQRLAEPDAMARLLASMPFQAQIEPYREQLLTKAGEVVGSAGAMLFQSVSAMTRGTINALLQLFVMLYCMYFFLMDGPSMLRNVIWYLPLQEKDERRLLERFTSVTRATLKGTLLIGVAQGVLAGLAFAVAGIEGAVFWGTVMIVTSVIPGVGAGLVWVPAVLVLLVTGETARGLLLAAFCGLVVSSIDNLLRPRLVGHDTQLHELLIFFGTVGGLLLFGMAGFIVGPVVAGLFVSVLDIYGSAFNDNLQDAGPPADA
ncbi:MAG: AI-2E family transporter [bacterium]|nr:AI-2E family transporter [bacterium]